MASRALMTRFSSTCSIWPTSTRAVQGSSASWMVSSTSSPRALVRMRSAPWTTSRRSTTCGLAACLRANVSSRRTSVAARSVAVRMPFTSARSSLSWPSRYDSSSDDPMMVVSRLLNSWAMPPASRPTASSFCVCISRSSMRGGSALAPAARALTKNNIRSPIWKRRTDRRQPQATAPDTGMAVSSCRMEPSASISRARVRRNSRRLSASNSGASSCPTSASRWRPSPAAAAGVAYTIAPPRSTTTTGSGKPSRTSRGRISARITVTLRTAPPRAESPGARRQVNTRGDGYPVGMTGLASSIRLRGRRLRSCSRAAMRRPPGKPASPSNRMSKPSWQMRTRAWCCAGPVIN